MSIIFKTTTEAGVVADFLAQAILRELNANKKVLWFVPGGSSIPVVIETGKIISKHQHRNLTITLTDERYGEVGHKDSNWQQLIEKGFSLPEAKLIPVLIGKDIEATTQNFSTFLDQELNNADYKIGLFGIGIDGHTAGILPRSEAVNSQNFVCGYKTQTFERITITPKVIVRLDEAVLYAQGQNKYKVLEELNQEININIQPAQILKKIPLLTIFSDKK